METTVYSIRNYKEETFKFYLLTWLLLVMNSEKFMWTNRSYINI